MQRQKRSLIPTADKENPSSKKPARDRTPRDLDVIGHRHAVQPLPARRVAQHVHVARAQGDAKGAALRSLVPWSREHEQRAVAPAGDVEEGEAA